MSTPTEREMALAEMEKDLKHGVLNHEGCDLHYYYGGSGPLITFIPGGNGHALQYHRLSKHFTPTHSVLTFDRRQMSSSQSPSPVPLSHPQQARDIHALITHLGFTSTILFGSSLGGIIAFQFAIDFPDMVEKLICHEAPTASLVPNSTEIYEYLYNCHQLYRKEGMEVAQKEFRKLFNGYEDPDCPKGAPSDERNEPSFWEWEFWTASIYTPDLRKLVGSKVAERTAVLAGRRSRGSWFCEGAREQAKILGCRWAEVPGHHGGFDAECELFVPVLMEVLGDLKGLEGVGEGKGEEK